MTTKSMVDKSGKVIRVLEFEGHYYGLFEIENVKHVTKMDARPDDLVILTYPKAGTHWVFEITRLLMAGTLDIPNIEKDDFMIEDAEASFIDNLPSPRNINTHAHADAISPQFIAQKSRLIYIIRDPRDTMVSFYKHHKKLPMHMYEGEFKDYFHMFIEGTLNYDSWFAHTKSWEKAIQEHPDNPILVLTFESMKQNPLENIRKISKFLGYDYSEQFLEQIVERTGIDTMRKERNTKDAPPRDQMIYGSGRSGDWKNWFTVAQSEQFNEAFEKEMVGTMAYKLYSHYYKGDNDTEPK